MLYESWNNTIVGEFGCIKHKQYPFLRASPDGINIDRNSPLYGRAVEIKNPVSRKLTGIPKRNIGFKCESFMEVWDLDECDFFETVFQEYETEANFYSAGELFKCKTKKNKCKGVIVSLMMVKNPFMNTGPLEYTKQQFDKWYDEIMEKHRKSSWIKISIGIYKIIH